MTQQSTSSAFMPMENLYLSDRTTLGTNPICNIHLHPGTIQTIVGRGLDGDRMALSLPISVGGGFVGLVYETRYNTLLARSFETEAEVNEWFALQVRQPTIDREPIAFEAEVLVDKVFTLTERGDLREMRTWFGTQMRAFVEKYGLTLKDGWINFNALPSADNH